MSGQPKRLGELLVEAGLVNASQLQEALRYQRMMGGRMGGAMVALGYITEEVLMDFLAHKTGVPRVDVSHVEVDLEVLKRIPRRLAEQLTVLPIAFKEPKSLVLAMAVALEPTVATATEHSFVAIETGGEWCRGQTVVDIRGMTGLPANTTIVLEASRERFVAMLHDAVRG